LRGNKFEHQLSRAETHHFWPLSMLGPEGPQLLMFEILGLGEAAPKGPGVFMYARRRAGEWQALYIGESANMADRLAFNEIAADALLSGATDIHVLRLKEDATARRDIVDRLILTNAPALNEDDRTRLSTAVEEPKAKTRAA
ncbi:MAG: hypothetical protein ABL996_25500, partial [Micropepsaceae bacterium]